MKDFLLSKTAYNCIWALAVTINLGWGLVNILMFNDLIGIYYLGMALVFQVIFYIFRNEPEE